MDITSIIILSLIVSAFVIFAVSLAYGDYATQQARRARANKPVQDEPQPVRAAIRHREAA